MIESPSFIDIFQQMIPKIVPALQSSDHAPKFTAHLSLDSPGFYQGDLTTSFVFEKKKENSGASELVQEIQKQIDALESKNSGKAKSRNSICDVLSQLGFCDFSKNLDLIDKYDGNVEKILDELLASL